MHIRLRYFASIRESLETDRETLETNAPTLAALRDELISRGGPHALALARGRTLRMALDQHLCDETATLHDGAEVAFFPPVTGG